MENYDNSRVTYENGCILVDGIVVDRDVLEKHVYRDENGNVSSWTPKKWFGYEYHIPVSEETTCAWSDCSIEKESYYDTLSTERLIIFADYAEYVHDTMPVIRALYKREPAKAIELTKAILEKGKGDEWLHERAVEFLKAKGVEFDTSKIKNPVLFDE